MRRRPPVPNSLWRSEVFPIHQEQSDEQVIDALWPEVRERGLAALDEVRSVRGSESLSSAPSSDASPDASVQGERSDTADHTVDQRQEPHADATMRAPSAEEGSSLYSFWYELGPTLAAILAAEGIDQEMFSFTQTTPTPSSAPSPSLNKLRSLRDESSHSNLRQSDLTQSDLMTTAAPMFSDILDPSVSLQSLDVSDQDHHKRGDERIQELNAQHGLISGAYGASRYLTWHQLISGPVRPSPSPVIDPPVETRGSGGARSTQRRRKMRIARVRAYYHQG